MKNELRLMMEEAGVFLLDGVTRVTKKSYDAIKIIDKNYFMVKDGDTYSLKNIFDNLVAGPFSSVSYTENGLVICESYVTNKYNVFNIEEHRWLYDDWRETVICNSGVMFIIDGDNVDYIELEKKSKYVDYFINKGMKILVRRFLKVSKPRVTLIPYGDVVELPDMSELEQLTGGTENHIYINGRIMKWIIPDDIEFIGHRIVIGDGSTCDRYDIFTRKGSVFFRSASQYDEQKELMYADGVLKTKLEHKSSDPANVVKVVTYLNPDGYPKYKLRHKKQVEDLGKVGSRNVHIVRELRYNKDGEVYSKSIGEVRVIEDDFIGQTLRESIEGKVEVHTTHHGIVIVTDNKLIIIHKYQCGTGTIVVDKTKDSYCFISNDDLFVRYLTKKKNKLIVFNSRDGLTKYDVISSTVGMPRGGAYMLLSDRVDKLSVFNGVNEGIIPVEEMMRYTDRFEDVYYFSPSLDIIIDPRDRILHGNIKEFAKGLKNAPFYKYRRKDDQTIEFIEKYMK